MPKGKTFPKHLAHEGGRNSKLHAVCADEGPLAMPLREGQMENVRTQFLSLHHHFCNRNPV